MEPLSGQESEVLTSSETHTDNFHSSIEPEEELEYNSAYERFQGRYTKQKSFDYEPMEEAMGLVQDNVAYGPLQQ